MRSLRVVCDLYHHDAVLNVDRFGDDVPLPAFGPRMAARLRDHRCIHAAELAGAAFAGELDRTAVAMSGPEAAA